MQHQWIIVNFTNPWNSDPYDLDSAAGCKYYPSATTRRELVFRGAFLPGPSRIFGHLIVTGDNLRHWNADRLFKFSIGIRKQMFPILYDHAIAFKHAVTVNRVYLKQHYGLSTDFWAKNLSVSFTLSPEGLIAKGPRIRMQFYTDPKAVVYSRKENLAEENARVLTVPANVQVTDLAEFYIKTIQQRWPIKKYQQSRY